jgi:hypothetical protein
MSIFEVSVYLEISILALVAFALFVSGYLFVLYHRRLERRVLWNLNLIPLPQIALVVARGVPYNYILAEKLFDIATDLSELRRGMVYQRKDLHLRDHKRKLAEYINGDMVDCLQNSTLISLRDKETSQVLDLIRSLNLLERSIWKMNIDQAKTTLSTIDTLLGKAYSDHLVFIDRVAEVKKAQQALAAQKERQLGDQYKGVIQSSRDANELNQAITFLKSRNLLKWVDDFCSTEIINQDANAMMRLFSILARFNSIDEMIAWCEWALSNPSVFDNIEKQRVIWNLRDGYRQQQLQQALQKQVQLLASINQMQSQLAVEQQKTRSAVAMMAIHDMAWHQNNRH